jgi:multicomponent Na+:H+ antiporter subunit E
MHNEHKWRIIRFILTTITLFAAWILFTADLKIFSLVTGMVGSLLIAAITHEVFIARHQANLRFIIPHPFFLIRYFFVVIFFLYQSSCKMLVAVITGRANPRIVHFRTRLRSDLARMMLSNSITFTPGTITLDLNDDHLTVHWFFCNTIHAKAAGESVKGRMEQHIRKIWL